jgi:glycopeptide antibiotics resistance protein
MDTSTIEVPRFFTFKGLDKIEHFLMFFGLSFIFFYEKFRKVQKKEFMFKLTENHKYLLFFILSGFLIEIFQPILSNRVRDLYDFLTDVVGSYAGFFVLVFFKKRFFACSEKKLNRKQNQSINS